MIPVGLRFERFVDDVEPSLSFYAAKAPGVTATLARCCCRRPETYRNKGTLMWSPQH